MSESHPYDPRARMVRLPSTVLGVAKSFFIYLPPEYEQGQRDLPALYLLRGHEREWVNPREDDSRNGKTVIDLYAGLRAAGSIGPLILVMPGLASDDNAVPSMLANMCAPQLAKSAGIGSGAFLSYFFDQLIPYVERTFGAHPAARAIAGFSLGGLMAIKAAARFPDRFASVGCFDGTVLYAADSGRYARHDDTVLANPMFDAALGLPRNAAFLDQDHPITLLLRADRVAIRRIRWLIQYGPEAIEPWGSNFYRGEYLLRALHALGIRNSAPVAALPDARHSWYWADRHIEQTLPIHWEAIQAYARR
ncbi:MAG: esterase family protein [Oscillochloris sp.]|nr:esterase family protein [Oscillochloris sp.]